MAYTSDDALSWLLSIPNTCESSPIRLSSPADYNGNSEFTDWFQLSPTSTPLQDVTSSARVNQLREPLNFTYDIANFYKSSQASFSSEPISHSSLPSSVFSGTFCEHNRMLSLGSEISTLLNTPSPQSFPLKLSVTSPAQAQKLYPIRDHLESSPSVNFFQDFQKIPFENYYDNASKMMSESGLFDISPVVRASDIKTLGHSTNQRPPISRHTRQKQTKRKKPQRTSFVQKLRSAAPPVKNFSRIVSTPDLPLLLSPVKLVASTNTAAAFGNSPHSTALDTTRETSDLLELGGLSPLTPIESSPQASPSPLKICIKIKRRPNPETPSRKPKRRRTVILSSSPTQSDKEEDTVLEAERSAVSSRTLPSSVPISDKFPLFYRKFPISALYQSPNTDSPCALFNVPHPGGSYNPPRNIFDLYTPRFVKGKGVEKVGLCPICVEPFSRGGDNKKLWLAMKFSAFKYTIYAHGVSASSGKPFSPPIGFRIVGRPSAGKNEKAEIEQGKCHKCLKWFAVEGIKDMGSKVPELHWWKHAATCHQDSSIEGDCDYFEKDAIYDTLTSLKEDCPS